MDKLKDLMYINEGHDPHRRYMRGGMIGGMAKVSIEGDSDIEYENSDDEEDETLERLLKTKEGKHKIEGEEYEIEQEIKEDIEHDVEKLEESIYRLEKDQKRLTERIKRNRDIMTDKNTSPEKATELAGVIGKETKFLRDIIGKINEDTKSLVDYGYSDTNKKAVLERRNELKKLLKSRDEQQKETDEAAEKLSEYRVAFFEKQAKIAELDAQFEKLNFTPQLAFAMAKTNPAKLKVMMNLTKKLDSEKDALIDEMEEISKKINALQPILVRHNETKEKFESLKALDNKTKKKSYNKTVTKTTKTKAKKPDTVSDIYKDRLLSEIDDLRDIYNDAKAIGNAKLENKALRDFHMMRDELENVFGKSLPDNFMDTRKTNATSNPIYDRVITPIYQAGIKSSMDSAEINKLKSDANEQIFIDRPELLQMVDKDRTTPIKSTEDVAFNDSFINSIDGLNLTQKERKSLLDGINVDIVKGNTIWEVKTFFKDSYDPNYNRSTQNYSQVKFEGTKGFTLGKGRLIDFEFDFKPNGKVDNIIYRIYKNNALIDSGNVLRPNATGYNYYIMENNNDALQYFNVSKNYHSFIQPLLGRSGNINIPNSKFSKLPKKYIQ